MTADLTLDELRALFLFEALEEDKLTFLRETGSVAEFAAGQTVFREGEPAACFYVLLSGTISMTRLVRGDEVEVTRTDHVGSYGGATQAYVQVRGEKHYSATFTAVTDCRFFSLPGAAFAALVRDWFPMAVHLLEGLFLGLRASNEVIGQRERLLALGSLTAGLTHELNNPAAAAVRATSALRERVRAMHHKLGMLADATIEPKVLTSLAGLQDDALTHIGTGSKLGRWPAATPRTTSSTGWRPATCSGRSTWRRCSWLRGSGRSGWTGSPTGCRPTCWSRGCGGSSTRWRPSS